MKISEIKKFLLLLLIIVLPAPAFCQPLPTTEVSDWSTYLDPEWKCGAATGSRWDEWKKTVLLFAASNGYGFKAKCKAIKDRDTIIVILRDNNRQVQYAAWYDPRSDIDREQTYAGISTVQAQIDYDTRQEDFKNYPLYSVEQYDDFYAWYMERLDDDPRVWEGVIAHQFVNSATRVNGCAVQYTSCGTGEIVFNNRNGWAQINIHFGNFGSNADGETVVASWYFSDLRTPGAFQAVRVAFAVAMGISGGQIGLALGLAEGTAGNAAFSAGFASFASGVASGQPVGRSLLDGIKGAALAYSGKLVLNSFGDPDSLVGVSGVGCPTGDQCWYFKMANGFPPLKNLAELHDPFINWSIKAFETVGQNGWYKAVTIAPFIVPGCLASDECVAAGITIVREDEIN
ncbi:hypothetical protein ACFOY5_20605 [Massilia aurea]|uniref:hypothetical protein n=1 Tax=Massilia aurea TaxID=373040 RepID=UPI002162D40D|nr:hypothetical protein [Massilia aurea]MCS0710048.1 hypothetical protein [Massilia aurea]